MPPLIVYLDQNHWIHLTRAYYGLLKGEQYVSFLESILRASQDGVAIFPMSNAHVIEIRKTADVAHRERLAHVISEISKGWTLAPSSYMVPKELRISLARMYNNEILPRPSAIGRGFAFAFGRSAELLSSFGATEETMHVLEERLADYAYLMKILVGKDEAINTQAVNDFRDRAQAFAGANDQQRKKGKPLSKVVRKRAYIADLTYHFQADITSILPLYKKSFGDFLALGKSKLVSFFESSPTLHVEVELAVERDDFWNKPIEANDMIDISFLSVAIPYCDVVITEKFWTDIAKRRKLDQIYDTVILSDLSAIERVLNT